MVVARYDSDWHHLSKEHEKIDKKISEIIKDYSNESLTHLSYAIIGTFGVGKTQLLYHIHKIARQNGLLPLYFIAEDLFREAISGPNKTFTPGDIFSVVENKITRIRQALKEKKYDEILGIVDPRGKLKSDVPEVIEFMKKEYATVGSDNIKVVMLVDELEGQYGILQNKVKTMDRSPLREWLEDKNYLKFLAFAPAGIYELGGADRDRVKRIVIPPADIDYVREKLISECGRSNACWWLSRGKARQLFKACEVLKEKEPNLQADGAARIIKTELDAIGQEPTQVPPAVTNVISPSKIPYLLNLLPIEGETAKRYVINAANIDTGILADKLVEAFNLNKDNALLISGYFKRTTKALSDREGITYIEGKELQELFCLVFDHLLEYEHGSPELSDNLGEILNLYETVKKEEAVLYGTIARLWEFKETKWQLPLTIEEIRKTFPFPTMNPIVRTHIPAEVKKNWEGKGLPIWSWTENDITALFFASQRDFLNYSETDEFISTALPEGRQVLCFFATGEKLKEEKPFIAWLRKNNKLEFAELPPLLTDFLLSAAGEIQGNIPADLQSYLKMFKEDKGDVLLLRKAEIYTEAISEKVSLPSKPEKFHKGALPDTTGVWGKGQMDRDIAIMGIALAFTDLTAQERELLAEVRELFRSGKEDRGSGDLNPLMPRGGFISLCDDLFPRYGKKKELKDSEPIGRLKSYWRDEERESLFQLARLVPSEHFLKLHQDEDMNRLLEALWKTIRKDFQSKELSTLIQKYEKKICPALDECWKLEQDLKTNFNISGVNFEDKEKVVKAKEGFNKFLTISKEINKDTATAAPLVKSILTTFMDIIVKSVEKNVNILESSSNSLKKSLEELNKEAENLSKNYWEYSKAAKFVGITDVQTKTIITNQKNIGGTPTLQELGTTANERKTYLEEISKNLKFLENNLKDLEKLFNQIMEKK
jgi:hypothetical protein